jgi:dihydrolipoamide dehydrogenase
VSTAYDVVVIGAGTGGYVAAIRAAQLGLRVAVVEKQRALGGTCLLWGCIPTKALLEYAHALSVVRRAKEWGVTLGGATATDLAVGIDMGQVQCRKDRIVSGLSKGVEFLFKKNKITWIKGTARLTGRGGVDVSPNADVDTGVHPCPGEPQSLQATKEIIVATGSSPRGIPGITTDRQRIITSDEAIALREVPKSLAIVGAGAVGVEFASIYARFGSHVTLFEALPRIMPSEDEQISEELAKALEKQGITVHAGATITGATSRADGVDLDAQLADGRGIRASVDYLLVAIGRTPVTTGLELERAGVELDRGYIRVDDRYRTNVPGISAIGDVITLGAGSHPQLAHVSSAEGVVTAERIAGLPSTVLDYDQIPRCTYGEPEIGSVGLTEREARVRGYDVKVGTFPFGILGRAKIAGETDGMVKIVSEARYDEILGVHMIGPKATELVAEAVMALRLEATSADLVRAIHAHPTMSEAVGEAAQAIHGAAIHNP